MRKKDMQEEITQLRDAVMEQGRDIVGLMLECERLKRVCGEAVEDIRLLGRQGQFICPVCSRYDHGKGLVGECVKCLKGEDCFEWRGVQHG